MCGAFGLIDLDGLASRFNLSNRPFSFEVVYKTVPTSMIPTISKNSPNRLVYRRWWLAPPWVDDPYKVKFATFNAQAENLPSKPAFRHAWKNAQRCLIPASYFIEWQTVADPDNPKKVKKLPYRIQLKGGGVFALAGLYEVWKDAEGKPVESCTIITTKSNSLVGQIHHRQAVILEPEAEEIWLNQETPLEQAYGLLKPFSSYKMEMFRIDERINKTRPNEISLEMVEPVE